MATKEKGAEYGSETGAIEFNNLRLTVRASCERKFGGIGPYIVKAKKTILNDLSGEFRPGQLTAIMGPSGAGKSSLLNVLAGFIDHDKTGTILVDGNRRKRSQFRKMSCYIMQYDEVLPVLTVLEAMRYAAQMKLPLSTTAAQRDSVIMDILETIGLTACKDTRAERLSGGQRKRLAIAFELINNPPVMFFDEPTSGLDSASCHSCVALLKSLARGGRTIIATIHQPSARILDYFDNLYLLAEGNCIYRGPVSSLVPFFARQGLQCPPYHNPADFAIEVAIGSYGDQWITTLSKQVELGSDSHSSGLAHDCSVSQNSLAKSSVTEGNEDEGVEASYDSCGESKKTSRQEDGLGKDSSVVVCLLPQKLHVPQFTLDEHKVSKPEKGESRICKLLTEFFVLLRRSFVCMQRDTLLVKIRFAAVVVVAFMMGIIFPESGFQASRAINNAGHFFFGIVFTIFCSIMTAVLTIPLERNVIVREHMNCWYSLKSYFAAKMFAEIPQQIFFPTLYTVISYLLTQQPLEWYRFGIVCLMTILTSLAAQAVGFAIGAAFNVQNAVILGAVSTVPFLLFTGFITSIKSIPNYARWFAYLSYPKYAFQACLLAVYGYDREALSCTEAYCHFKSPKKILEQFDVSDVSAAQLAVSLLALTIVVRLSSYWILKARIRWDKSHYA